MIFLHPTDILNCTTPENFKFIVTNIKCFIDFHLLIFIISRVSLSRK